MKFIHCSDIHLGKTLEGNRERYRDYFDAFSRVIDLALEEKVDFMIIAGDLFHRGNIAPSTLADTIEILEPLKKEGIPIIAIEGNHDLYHRRNNESWLHFLSRRGYLRLLRPTKNAKEGTITFDPFDEKKAVGGWIEINGLTIYGLGYFEIQAERMLNLMLESLPPRADMAIFHCGVWDKELIKIGRISFKDILPLKDRFRYVALGHGHKPYEVFDRKDPDKKIFAFNPGSLEAVNREEADYSKDNEGKVYLVEMDKDNMKASPVFLPRRPYLNLKVDVEDAIDFEHVFEITRKILEERKSGLNPAKRPVLMIVLTGKIKFAPINIDISKLEILASAILNPIYANICNDTSMFRRTTDITGGKRNMDKIYRDTILDLIDAHPKYREKKEDILDLILNLKEMIIDKDERDQELIIDRIHEKRMEIDG